MSTSLAPRRGRGKSKHSLDLIDAASTILQEIQPATVRAVCYRLFVAGYIDSMEKPDFYALMFRRREPIFYAFDLLMLNGRDLRGLPLLERKRRLRAITPDAASRLLYLDHVAGRGRDLFRLACERDLEGIVAKWAQGLYQPDGRSTSWLKIKNPHYSQMEGRRELFESRRDGARSTFRAKPPLELRMA